MNRPNCCPTRWAKNQEADDDRALKTVLIYENFAVGLRAQPFFETLASGLSRSLKGQMWDFGVLGIREVRNVAASAARKADAVAVALAGQRDLPGTIRAWLDMWLWLLEDEKPPLIALFDLPSAPEVPRIRTHLSCMVARAGIEFFSAQRQVSLAPAVGVAGSHADRIWPTSVEQALLAKLSPRFARQRRPSSNSDLKHRELSQG